MNQKPMKNNQLISKEVFTDSDFMSKVSEQKGITTSDDDFQFNFDGSQIEDTTIKSKRDPLDMNHINIDARRLGI